MWQAKLGAVIWLLAAAWWRPSPFAARWAELLLLLAALVLVPLGLRLAAVSLSVQLPAAALLAVSFALPPGNAAAALALPWLATTVVIAAFGLRRLRHDPCIGAALSYLAIGGLWTVATRWGLRPLGFEPVIVLLTAIHFHYAAFVLPLITGLAISSQGGRPARSAAAWLVIAGPPLTAIGITATQLGYGSLLEFLAALGMSLGGLLAAGLHVRLAWNRAHSPFARVLWGVAAVSLAGSMILAALYGARAYAPIAWLDIPLDIPWMRALHGSANAFGCGLASLLAWSGAASQPARPEAER
jgi:hypothetical protein